MSENENLQLFLANHSFFETIEKEGKWYVLLSSNPPEEEIRGLLQVLHMEKFEISFYDSIYPSMTDPGAYFTYSTEKSKDELSWSMTYGNHGWSGGIYYISTETLGLQIRNLMKKVNLRSLQISDCTFFKHYDLETKEKSILKDEEISELHK